MMRTFVILIVLLTLLIWVKPVSALSLSISNLPTSIDRDQETEIDLFFSCAGCGDYSYIRSVFYPAGTNYFGFTQNNSGSWIGTVSDRSQYFVIAKTDLIEASWSGKIKVKPDSSDSAYIGPGEYMFKVGRYTSAGDSSADWSNELAVRITGPTPAPTIIVTSTPNPTPAPTQTPNPTPTKTTTPVPSRTPLKTVVPTPSPEVTPDVLGQTSEELTLVSPTPVGKSQRKFPFLAVTMIASGLFFIGGACYVAFKH